MKSKDITLLDGCNNVIVIQQQSEYFEQNQMKMIEIDKCQQQMSQGRKQELGDWEKFKKQKEQ
ncbi:unnamed protein product (macronuclear) [Paramecium tetraurelia]|uniref:Chromosome undetermined scaffold_25, whole genome shotgun sequence n=1 Tax=Paramecium tetraurelia TaxID=5888 RepID=A0CR55_PARTE|nr:uncharacterized protein GSPATT00009587001 [Paramecium tetraurelia]XP_001447299.1 uncharacterized protein GSPATT00039352001 [Paramecium tetraurelia]CAK73272.1 unnamed protein product [Paramecium tetraurelia]CAK79902.1 unnamed protein product [Paramecium tetraurelia]|eukprot:XP_001440669.1 hypothetical protein (macronuclear) [Paramecium tetraurelia strain d4-2]